MSRRTVWSAALFALAVALGTVAPWEVTTGAAQVPKQPDLKKTEPPKKGDPKTPDAKKADPKKAEPPKKTEPPKKIEPPKKAEPKPPDAKPAAPPEPTPELALGAANPLDLVRGLRDHGMADLALELLKDLEKKPGSPAEKAEIPLERARCLLEAADDEPDEGTRTSLIGEAKDGFTAFLLANPDHPRGDEAALALARLAALDAKAQLSKARKVELPDEGDAARGEAVKKQKAEAGLARAMFKTASDKFKTAAARIDARIKTAATPPARRALALTKYDAELAAAVNQFALADTFLHPDTAEKVARAAEIDKARESFRALDADPDAPARVGFVARAWMAECEFEKNEPVVAKAANDRLLAETRADAEDGKRTVRFFQVRRRTIEAQSKADYEAAEKDARAWLAQYGSVRRAQGEAVAVTWYLGLTVKLLGDAAMPTPPKAATPTTTPPLTVAARGRYVEAEKLFRKVSQTDNEYAARATRQRTVVVRRLLGEADKPAAEYATFEDAQMASLIQMSKATEAEKDGGKEAEVKDRRLKIVALLERSRRLATDRDNPADVAEVLIRLIYFYQLTDQPLQAAVLGEHVARTVKSTGGKSSAAGSLGVNGYVKATGQIKTTEAGAAATARKADRDRAVRLARFLDEKFPNDAPTDAARHQLAALLNDDGKPVEAFDVLLKVRPGYAGIGSVRLFEGAVATQLLYPKDSPLPAERKRDVFRRAAADLEKLTLAPPDAAADADAVRLYFTARSRLALLYILQPRVDPEGEKTDPGYAKSKRVAEDALARVPAFAALTRTGGDAKALTPDGWEMKLLTEDARTKAVILEGQTLFFQRKYDEAYGVIGKVLAEMRENGPYAQAVERATAVKDKPEEKKDPKPDDKAPAPKKDDKTPDAKKDAPPPAPKEDDAPLDDGPPDAAAGNTARLVELAGKVDKRRLELVVMALKLRVRQGKAEEGVEQLELLKQFGGSIEQNIPTLQQVTGEMAGQIVGLRQAGKADEAKALADGFAKLLNKLSAEPNLPPTVHLFLGQSLALVGEFGKAEEALNKIPAPAPEVMLKPLAEVKDDERRAVLLRRRATLELVRVLRQSKKYAEGEAVLAAAMGTQQKQGWAFPSLEFRKEVAYLYEAKGADLADIKTSNTEWGKAVKEWASLVSITTKRMQTEPKGANGEVDNAAVLRNKNAYYEAFFDYNRCIVKANMHLLKDNPKLAKTFETVGKKFADLEKTAGTTMNDEVRELYWHLLADIPQLLGGYTAAGGELFLKYPGPDGGNLVPALPPDK